VDATLAAHYSHMWGYPYMDFQKDSRTSKIISQLIVEEVKTLPLDGYPAMLYIGLPGGDKVPFFGIVSCSIIEQKHLRVIFCKHNRGGWLYSSG